jgi:hypothetical protein
MSVVVGPVMMRRTIGAVAVCALAVGGIAAATVANAAGESITISYPAEGQAVGTGPLTVAGSVTSGGAGDLVSVLYAVDVSGSTSSPTGLDCNGDGAITAQLDDFNQDGSVGDTLDCEISGIVALNAALRAVPNSAQRIRAGLVGFGDDAAVADLEPGAQDQPFAAPGDTRGDRDVVPRINAVAGSLTRGTIGLETPRSVGQGADFQRPLDVATAVLTSPGPKWIFLLSDWQASVPHTTALVAAGVRVRTSRSVTRRAARRARRWSGSLRRPVTCASASTTRQGSAATSPRAARRRSVRSRCSSTAGRRYRPPWTASATTPRRSFPRRPERTGSPRGRSSPMAPP